MVSHFQEQESFLQNPIFDALYCEEERFDECLGSVFDFKEPEIEDFNKIRKNPFAEHDLFWEDEELAALLSKEKKQAHLIYDEMNPDASLKTMRNEAVKWILNVVGYYGFNALTAVLAVNYYDRFITSVFFQRDKPWMSQLVAVACLSVAAKVEETQVPLLLDLQVEESKYLFEAKTIQRMELLVLSTLKWKMNPVTPISFFDHIVRRFEFKKNLHWDFLKRCASIILSIINDCRLVNYLPSVISAAAMIHVIRETEARDAIEYENQLVRVLKASKEKVDDCYKLIVGAMDAQMRSLSLKRKHDSIPSSPSGVIDAYLSSDSSVDSWAVEPPFKRSKAQDQHMRLPFGLVNRAN